LSALGLLPSWGTGVRGLLRGMATLPQGNQRPSVVKDKIEKPQVSLGSASLWNVIFSLHYFDIVGWASARTSGL